MRLSIALISGVLAAPSHERAPQENSLYLHNNEMDYSLGNEFVFPRAIESQMDPKKPVVQESLPVGSILPQAQIHDKIVQLRNAMMGLGANESVFINILPKESPAEIEQLKSAYFKEYKVSLANEVAKETSGHFGEVCDALLMSPAEYDAFSIHSALKGSLFTNEAVLVEVIAARSIAEINFIKAAYLVNYHQSMTQEIADHTGGYLREFLVASLETKRDAKGVIGSILSDVDKLFTAGEAKWGADQLTFIDVLTGRSFEHLLKVMAEYRNKYKKDLIDVVQAEFRGNLEDGLVAILESAESRVRFLSEQFKSIMWGMGAEQKKLIRLVVRSRDPELMGAIKIDYAIAFKDGNEKLYERMMEEASGNYQRILLAIIGK